MAHRQPRPKSNHVSASEKLRRKTCRIIVLVDQEPLRRKASVESRKLMKDLDRARLELQGFEREDQPAFEHWMAAKFGHVLTGLREIATEIAEKTSLLLEIEDELFYGGCASHFTAWKRVMNRRATRAHGADGADDESNSDHDPFDSAGDDPFDPGRAGKPPDPDDEPLSDAEIEDLFCQFLHEMFGVRARLLDRKTRAAVFREFKASVLGMEDSPPPRRSSPSPARAAPGSPQARVKALYRLLVRRLHPDMRADGDPSVSALWHEVQTAYAAGDLDRLETLLGLTDVRDNLAGAQTSLSQWFKVIAELKASIKAVRASLRRARRDRAWNFVRRSDRESLEAQVEAEMEESLAAERAKLKVISETLELWSQPPPIRSRRGGKQRRREPTFEQDEFFLFDPVHIASRRTSSKAPPR